MSRLAHGNLLGKTSGQVLHEGVAQDRQGTSHERRRHQQEREDEQELDDAEDAVGEAERLVQAEQVRMTRIFTRRPGQGKRPGTQKHRTPRWR